LRIWAVIIFGGGVLLGYGLTQSAPVPAPAARIALADVPATPAAKPVQAPTPPPRPPAAATAAREPLGSAPPPQPRSAPAAANTPAPTASPPPTKRTGEILTAAAIAALIVAESRRAYYATGHPCACPEDSMRNGRRCGNRSAYSRPGGAAPLCYPTDVSDAMIRNYQSRIAER
jgi:hypothetical protein